MKRIAKSLKSVAQPQSIRSSKSSTPHPISTGEIDAVVDLSSYIKKSEEHCVGGGRFGNVYKGTRSDKPDLPEEDRRVAIKVIRPLMVRNDVKSKVVKRLKREIAVWQGLTHKNIVPFLGLSYSFGSMPAPISVWMENGQLDVYLSEHPEAVRSAIAEGLASGLLYLHTRDPKVIHGAIKTANTLVDRAGNARLCDFGLSRMMAEDDLWMTTTANSRGSVRWMAPELLEGTQVLPTPESDVYALAMTILEMVTGRVPFHHHRSDHAVTIAILFQKEIPSRPIEVIGSGMWQVGLDALWECLTMCWDPEPERRPSVAVVAELFRLGRESCMRIAIDIPTVIPSEPFIGHEGPVYSVAFSPGGKRIVSGSGDSMLRVWDAETGEVVSGPFEGHTDAVSSVAFSPDGKQIASGSHDATVLVWNAVTGEVVSGPFEGHTDAVSSVTFSPDGRQIASGSHDDTVLVWNAVTGKVIAGPFEGHEESVYSVAFSPDGNLIASGSYDKTVRVWNAVTGEMVSGPFKGHTYPMKSVAFCPDGKRIASGSWDHTARMWNSVTGKALSGPLEGHDGSAYSVALSPDGNRVASGAYDKTMRLWTAVTRKHVPGPFQGHTGSVNSVAFSPDGKRLASGSFDQTVRVWNAETGEALLAPFEGHTKWVTSVAFSPDCKRIASGSYDQTVRVWNAE